MAIVVESSNSNTTASGTSLSITKPTGLAVGDLLVGCIYAYNTVGVGATINTPTNWTLTETATGTPGADGHAIATFVKVADSADVAASNFAFTTGATYKIYGLLMRLSGMTSVAPYTNSQAVTSEDTLDPAFTYSLTPTYANSLLVLATAGATNEVWYSITSPVINGTNPTWTNRYNGDFKVFTAPYPNTTQITSLDYTEDSSASNTSWPSMIVAVHPRIDDSTSNTLATTTSTSFTQSGTCDTVTSNTLTTATSETFTQAGIGTSPTQWTNATKPTTTWINEE
jgi:hypothetical protein